MHYEPIKETLGNFFNKSPFLRKVFYKLLDLLLLRSWHVHRELKKWKKDAPKNPKILDAGFGFGQYTLYIKNLFPSTCILGVDMEEDQVSDCNQFFRAIKKENVLFKVANLLEFQKPNMYDLCLCADVLEHTSDDQRVMNNILISLKPGGMLLVSSSSDTAECEKEHLDDSSCSGYSMDEIKEKLRKAGFSKIKAHYSYGVPGKLSWKLSMKYPMKMLSISKIFLIILPFYYLIIYPIAFILNIMDVRRAHITGSGLVVKAWK